MWKITKIMLGLILKQLMAILYYVAVSIGAHKMMLPKKVAHKVPWLSSISSKPLTIEILI